MATPTIRGVGAWASGTTGFTAAVPTGGSAPVSGDAMYIIMESADTISSGGGGTPDTPGGWSKLFEQTQPPAGSNPTTLTIFGKIAGASEADVSITGVGDHCSGSMLVIAGHGLSVIGDTLVGTGNVGSGTTTTFLDVTTTVNDSLVVMAAATGRDQNSTANFASYTNANLASIAEREDHATNTGGGGGVGYATGEKATAGATGDSTVTHASAVNWVAVHLVVKATGGAAATSMVPPVTPYLDHLLVR